MIYSLPVEPDDLPQVGDLIGFSKNTLNVFIVCSVTAGKDCILIKYINVFGRVNHTTYSLDFKSTVPLKIIRPLSR